MLCCEPALQALVSRHQPVACWSTVRQVLRGVQRRSLCGFQQLSRPTEVTAAPCPLPPCFIAASAGHSAFPVSSSSMPALAPAVSTALLLCPHMIGQSCQTLAPQTLSPLVLMSKAEQQQQTSQQQQQQQTPRSSKNRVDQEDKEAIERLKKEVKRFQGQTTSLYKNPCKVSANYSKTCTLYELNAVKYHLEEFIPRFFVSLMDYSLFTPDVVFINQMHDPPKVSRGVYRISLDRVKLKLYYDIRFALKKPIVLRIDTDQANSCLAIRFRIRCIGGLKPFTQVREMNRMGVAAYVEKNGEWHDYLLHVHVTNDARVWQLRLTNLTEDKGKHLAQVGPPSLLQRLRQLLRRRAPLPSAL